MDPGDERGRPTTDRPATNNLDAASKAQEYDRAARLARRLRLDEVRRRRRVSRELDRLLAPAVAHCPCCRASTGDGPLWTIDYAAAGLDLTVPERQQRGRELAAAGYTP